MKFTKTNLFKVFFAGSLLIANAGNVIAQKDPNPEMENVQAPLNPKYSWTVSANAGPLLFYGDLRAYPYWAAIHPIDETNLGYGLSLAKQISPMFGIQANFLAGDLSGQGRTHNDNNKYSNGNNWILNNPIYFKGNITEFSLTGKFNIIPLFVNHPTKFDVIGYAGAGVTMFRAVSRHMLTDVFISSVGYTNTDNGTNGNLSTPGMALAVPVGFILNYNISPRVSIGLDLSERFTSTDNLDAHSVPGSYFDQYGYYAFTLSYNFGSQVRYKHTVTNYKDSKYRSTEKKEDNKEIQRINNEKEAKAEAEKQSKDNDAAAEQQRRDNEAKAEQQRKDNEAIAEQQRRANENKVVEKKTTTIVATVVENQSNLSASDKKYVENVVIKYDYNKSAITPEFIHNLDRLIGILDTHQNCTLTITGHADSKGSEPNNIIITQRRADEVKGYLVQKGVPNPDRLKTVYAGSSHPLKSNKTAAGRAANRRIALRISCN